MNKYLIFFIIIIFILLNIHQAWALDEDNFSNFNPMISTSSFEKINLESIADKIKIPSMPNTPFISKTINNLQGFFQNILNRTTQDISLNLQEQIKSETSKQAKGFYETFEGVKNNFYLLVINIKKGLKNLIENIKWRVTSPRY